MERTHSPLLLGFAPDGVYLPLLHRGKCALTTLFHPYPPDINRENGIISVALSSPCGDLSVFIGEEHPVLWSPDFPPRPDVKSGRGNYLVCPGYCFRAFFTNLSASLFFSRGTFLSSNRLNSFSNNFTIR